MQVSAVGIPWYRKEDYARLLTIFEDANKLPPTFEDWLAKAEHLRDMVKSKGAICIEAIIDPDQFPGWCAINGHPLNASGRNAFANLRARDSYLGRN